MLWGQQIKVYTDHMNLIRDACGLTSNRVYQWRMLLEDAVSPLINLGTQHGGKSARTWMKRV